MKTLDELEQNCAFDCLHPRDVKRALPALIRVARAAEELLSHLPYDAPDGVWPLRDALQHLRDLEVRDDSE